MTLPACHRLPLRQSLLLRLLLPLPLIRRKSHFGTPRHALKLIDFSLFSGPVSPLGAANAGVLGSSAITARQASVPILALAGLVTIFALL